MRLISNETLQIGQQTWEKMNFLVAPESDVCLYDHPQNYATEIALFQQLSSLLEMVRNNLLSSDFKHLAKCFRLP